MNRPGDRVRQFYSALHRLITGLPQGLLALPKYLRRQWRRERLRSRFPTWMFPILADDDHRGRRRTEQLRLLLQDTASMDQALRDCPMLHMIRFQVVGDLTDDPGKRLHDVLRSSYLVVIAELDAHFQDFGDWLFDANPEFATRLFEHCVGFEPEWLRDAATGVERVAFRNYLRRCTMKTNLPFWALEASVAQVRTALQRQRAFTALVVRCQHATPDAIADEWRSFLAENRDLPFIDSAAIGKDLA